MEKYDFSGWATRNDLKCSDGRTIRKDAFKHNDGVVVPIVWNHQHDSNFNILGHALLENRTDGVYAYGKFNDTESGRNAKLLVKDGDISALSIYANKLKQDGGNVLHGDIKEVSLVLAGANPGAFIRTLAIEHSEFGECEEAEIFTGEDINICHGDDKEECKSKKEDNMKDTKTTGKSSEDTKEVPKDTKTTGKSSEDTKEVPKDNKEETIEDVFNTLSEKQKTVVYAIVGKAMEHNNEEEGEEKTMKHNVFDNEEHTQEQNNVLCHSDMEAIISDAKRYGTLRESAKAHDAENIICHADGDYGIKNLNYLFPEATSLNTPPTFISRDMGWVSNVMGGVHHTPFSKIKSVFANITEAEARAKGYIKGNLKTEEVFSLLKRTTDATTIYKKQKMDRDDVIEITDFDVVTWLKSEMRVMLDEEIARSILVGDGRLASSEDKIAEDKIRPIWKDDALFTVKKKVTFAASDTSDQKAKKFIQAAIKSRKDYKGSGNPTLYTTEDILTDCLLMEDTTGRVIYESVEKLATALRVKEIITVQALENQNRTGTTAVDGDTSERTLLGLIVNLADYNVGADKGGAVSMFDDFDIDYNQQKYLIETRCSGALTVPYSAIALESVTA